MPFSVSCPECRYQFRVPDHVAGQRGKCPKCKAMFLAERESDGANATASQPAVAAAKTTAAAVSIAEDETVVAKPRTLSIPKPRLLEKLTPPPSLDVPLELVDEEPAGEAPPPPKSKSVPPPAPPAPPRGAPPKSAPPKAPAKSAAVTASSPALQLKTDNTAASADGESGAVYAHRRKKKSKLPLVIGLAAVALLVVGGVGTGIAWNMLSSHDAVAQNDANGKGADNANDPDSSAAPATTDGDDESETDDNPFDPPVPLANWESLRDSVVTITVSTSDGTREGVGVLVSGGYVATSFQLLHEADAAVVTLQDGRKFAAESVLKRPLHSLALLRLDDVEGELPKLELASATPAPQSTIYIADAQAAHGTKILRRLTVSALPAATRPKLPELMRENEEIQLIEHAARTGTSPAGGTYELPSGAPLLSATGQVVGVNLALGGDAKKGYAVGVEQLKELIGASVTEAFRPLRIGDVASNDVPDIDPVTPEAENPFDPPFDPPPTTTESPTDAVVAKLKELGEKLGEKKWLPETADDYLAFAEYASSATTAADLIDKLESPAKEDGQAKLEEALDLAARAPWPSTEQMQKVGKLATDVTLVGNRTTGAFVYAECILRPENLNGAQINGLPVYGFKLTLSDEMVLIPVSTGGDTITVGSEWLILGQKVGDAEIGNEGMKSHASILQVKYMFQEPAAE